MLEAQLRSFLEERKVPFIIAKKSFITDCINPACGKEGHMWIKKQTGRTICFKCGTRWSWRSLVATIAKIPVSKVADLFFGSGAGDFIEEVLDPDLFNPKHFKEIFGGATEKPITLGPDFVWLELSGRAIDYLVSRGVSNVTLIAKYDLRYVAAMDAVVFPVKYKGVNYGWQARRIDPKEDELRLITSPSFNKSHFLLNYDRANLQQNLILVEGPFDCLKVDLEGYGAVASLGKGVSQDQIKLILDAYATNVYLGLDPDASEEIYQLIQLLGFKKKVFRITPPSSRKDFGECDEGEVREAITKAIAVTSQTDILDVYLRSKPKGEQHGRCNQEKKGSPVFR